MQQAHNQGRAPTHPPQLSHRHLLPVVCFVSAETTRGRPHKHAGVLRVTHFVPHVDLAEAEGAEMGAGLLYRRLDLLVEQFLHKLTDVGPHLFHCLRGNEYI